MFVNLSLFTKTVKSQQICRHLIFHSRFTKYYKKNLFQSLFLRYETITKTNSRIHQNGKSASMCTDIVNRCQKAKHLPLKYTYMTEQRCLCIRVPTLLKIQNFTALLLYHISRKRLFHCIMDHSHCSKKEALLTR